MDELDMAMQNMANGLTPDLISVKVGEYKNEYEGIKEALVESGSTQMEEDIFRGFVMHKLAAMDTVLSTIIGFLNEEEE